MKAAPIEPVYTHTNDGGIQLCFHCTDLGQKTGASEHNDVTVGTKGCFKNH